MVQTDIELIRIHVVINLVRHPTFCSLMRRRLGKMLLEGVRITHPNIVRLEKSPHLVTQARSLVDLVLLWGIKELNNTLTSTSQCFQTYYTVEQTGRLSKWDAWALPSRYCDQGHGCGVQGCYSEASVKNHFSNCDFGQSYLFYSMLPFCESLASLYLLWNRERAS